MTRRRVWQSFDDSEEGQSSLAQARIYLLNLLATSMASAWQYLVRGPQALTTPSPCVPGHGVGTSGSGLRAPLYTYHLHLRATTHHPQKKEELSKLGDVEDKNVVRGAPHGPIPVGSY